MTQTLDDVETYTSVTCSQRMEAKMGNKASKACRYSLSDLIYLDNLRPGGSPDELTPKRIAF